MNKLKNTAKAITVAGSIFVAEAFVGEIDWLNVMDLPVESSIRRAAGPIGIGYQQKGIYTSRCNYWAIGERMVLANDHCIEEANAKGIKAYFTEDINTPVICEKILASSPWESFDYLLLGCDGDVPEPPHLDPREIVEGEELLHISHNCDYYKDPQCKIVPKYDNSEDCRVFGDIYKSGVGFKQGCDSLGGSSGSPVYSRKLNKLGKYSVIGLHHSGAFFQDERGTKEGRGKFNGVVKISEVLKDLKSKGFDLLKQPKNDEPVKIERVSFWRALIQLIKSYL